MLRKPLPDPQAGATVGLCPQNVMAMILYIFLPRSIQPTALAPASATAFVARAGNSTTSSNVSATRTASDQTGKTLRFHIQAMAFRSVSRLANDDGND